MSASPRQQRGVALLVALLVVALAVILVAALLDRGELTLARTRNALRSEQAEAYARGLEIYAAQVLIVAAAQGAGAADTNASPWALPLPPQQVPGGMISATMRDLNGCFNLNNLSPRYPELAAWDPVFANLLSVLQLDPALRAAIKEWLGAGDPGSTDGYYLALPVPYRPRDGLFTHVSELRLVRGVSSDVYARLAPYVCALPPGTRININTASVPVLQSLGSPLTQAVAEKLWSDGHADYQDVAPGSAFMTAAAAADPILPTRSGLLDVHSTYFLAQGDISLDKVPFTFYSVIERGQQGGGIRVLERSRGSDDALITPAPIAQHDDDGGLD
jgi:general secretion pathway protein K